MFEAPLIKVISNVLPERVKKYIRLAIDRIGPLPQRVTAGPAKGLTLFAPLRRRSYCSGLYEPDVLGTLTRLLGPGMAVCDVGAHYGYFTLAISQLVQLDGMIYAFEPFPTPANALKRSVIRNRLVNVEIVPKALGAKSGQARLEIWSNDAMCRIVEGQPTPWEPACITVPMTTLDDWSLKKGLQRLDLIKLDVEGYELAVLAGAEHAIEGFRPIILCEIHRGMGVSYRPASIVEWLEKASYQVSLISAPDRRTPPLDEALARLEKAQPPTGYMSVIHVLATPQRK